MKNEGRKNRNKEVDTGKNEFNTKNIWKLLSEQMFLLRNETIIIAADAKIKDDLSKQRKAGKHEIYAVALGSHHILYGSVNSKNP